MRQYLDKRLFVQLNGSRKVIGVLRGFDVRTLLCAHFFVCSCPLPCPRDILQLAAQIPEIVGHF